MKKILSYMLLLIYSSLLLRPVFPFITDITSHIFNYSAHMATVHVENGRYHVHHELQENSKKDNPQKESTAIKKDVSGNEYIIFTQKYMPAIIDDRKKDYVFRTSFLVSAELTNNYPPPRA